jgi:integrase
MINRSNYVKTRAFLDYLEQVIQLRDGSVDIYRSGLKRLIIWAGELPFKEASEIRPSFPAFLARSRSDGRPGTLAPVTAKKVIQVVRRFLTWAKLMYPSEFKPLSQLWIDSLKPPRLSELPHDHEFVTIDEIREIAHLDLEDDQTILRRDQAAACLLFLSGMRAGAFVSLPIQALNLEERCVKQWPSLGVYTKMGKSATTYLLDIPDLMKPVRAWDQHLRAHLPATAMWYTPTVNYWGDQRLSPEPPGSGRVSGLGRRMRKLFAVAGLPHRSPHKFRHGHAVFALQNAHTMADYKAVSMNLMHADIKVTDGIYAVLAGDEVQHRIGALTRNPAAGRQPDSRPGPNRAELSREEIAVRLMDLARRLAS